MLTLSSNRACVGPVTPRCSTVTHACSIRPSCAPRVAPRVGGSSIRVIGADDSETMGQDNMRRQPEEGGQQPAEVVFTEQDIQGGNQEGRPANPLIGVKAGDAALGTEFGSAAGAAGVGSSHVDSGRQGEREGEGDAGAGAEENRAMSDAATPVSGESASAVGGGEGESSHQPEGGRFDEEAEPGNHPYDPRPRERGHGVPPHKDASNTGPAGSP